MIKRTGRAQPVQGDESTQSGEPVAGDGPVPAGEAAPAGGPVPAGEAAGCGVRMPRRRSIALTGFAHRNPVPAACRIGPLLVSGALTGRDPATGAMPAGLDAQLANVFAHVRELMATAGGAVDDIAKMTFLLADYRDRDALNREWTAMFPDPDDRPTRHCIAATLDGGSLVQADVLAWLGER